MTIKRIMIIGGPGAGKSWLAQHLGQRHGLPVYAVDDSVWDEAGVLRTPDEIDARVRQLADQDKWIIEGGNSRTYPDRVQRADMIIRLAPSKWLRFFRVLRRDGLRLKILKWTLQYDDVFGPKDDRAFQAGRRTATCIDIPSSRDIDRLLHQGLERF